MKILQIFLCLFVGFCDFAGAEMVDKIVAVVNDEVITQSELDEYLRPVYEQYHATYGEDALKDKFEELRKRGLLELIEERLILQEAKRNQIQVKNIQLYQGLEKLKDNFASEKEFHDALNRHNLTPEEFQEKYKERLMMQKLVDIKVRSQVTVSPAEVQEYYNAHLDEFSSPESAKVSVILIRFGRYDDEQEAFRKADEIILRLKSGEDFHQLAREYSQGPNASEGGDLGFVKRGELISDVDREVFSLSEGEISKPIRTDVGIQIIKVEEKRPAKSIDFAEAMQRIEEFLYRKRFRAAYAEWILKLKEKSYIAIK